ncbi:MAG TPA: hypothetical protein VLS94_08775 [Fusibacter sp.]|nr:hypothetical protein [Fusibacter sp.]
MKLSEVIKAIEDGSKSEFKYGNYMIVFDDDLIRIKVPSKESIYINPKKVWEEVKPLRQWSEKELMLFKLLPDWAKWIAKDKDGGTWLYEEKPTESENEFIGNLGKNKNLELFDFLTITFEESPIYIGDLKGE